MLPNNPPPVFVLVLAPNGDAFVFVFVAVLAPPPKGEFVVAVFVPNPPNPEDVPPPNISIEGVTMDAIM